jgi:NAD-dependent dihydropyrimidine dehydrogenase PreA subunit
LCEELFNGLRDCGTLYWDEGHGLRGRVPGGLYETQLYIHPTECIDCGACVPVCPVTAIFALEDLPEKWSNFAAINSDWYSKKQA